MASLCTRTRGDIGEDIACKFIQNKGFSLILRNYRKAWGEIDIIARKDGVLHFIEVKSITATSDTGHRPEENVHGNKQRHIRRMIQTYYLEHGLGSDTEFQFHVITVKMNERTRRASVKMIENIIL
ncbi:MAG: YraN family protein [Patescibacteria group bacterium]|nr:YraN family protein [Patescibacteria group bacterium]